MARSDLTPALIKSRLEHLGRGSVFVASDFFDIADKKPVRQALLRMEEEGLIERVLRGVYLYPEYNDLLKRNVPADPGEVAKAIARNFNWTISPSGETALNQLGLSTQVPAIHEYLSDGPYKSYQYGKVQLVFKHRANREMTGTSYKTRLVIQALKALGKEYVDQTAINRLSRILSCEEAGSLLAETRYSSDWIHDIAIKINQEIKDA